MTNIELALTNLGEASAIEIHKSNNSHNMKKLKDDTNKAGNIVNKAKTELESVIHKKIITKENHIELTDNNNL